MKTGQDGSFQTAHRAILPVPVVGFVSGEAGNEGGVNMWTRNVTEFRKASKGIMWGGNQPALSSSFAKTLLALANRCRKVSPLWMNFTTDVNIYYPNGRLPGYLFVSLGTPECHPRPKKEKAKKSPH